jgi:alpha-galactosidase
MTTKPFGFAPLLAFFTSLLPACGSDEDEPETDVDSMFPVALAEGLAPTPPMGWNSWNRFGCNVRAELVMEMADAMVDSGMRDAGYRYVNIDDCWLLPDRNSDGSVQFSPFFPNGIEEVADYVHERGLKLGIYSDRGAKTCAGRAGAEGFEELDAQTYAEWGVDYLKHDNCNARSELIEQQYKLMGDALKASGRDIVYSLCAWNFYEWGVGVGHLWRTTTDIRDNWLSILDNLEANHKFAPYAGPNGWNDPDMLEVGNESLTDTEYRSHFALWAISAAPLIAGNDLTNMTPETLDILTNPEIIAINQDALGLQGVPVNVDGPRQIWAKPLNESGARAVVFFNGGNTAADMVLSFTDIGLRAGRATARDLWERVDRGTFTDTFIASVPAHGVVALKVVGTEPRLPEPGTTYVSDLSWTYSANGLGPVERDSTNGATEGGDGTTMTLDGQAFERGLGVAAPSLVIYRLGQKCSRFKATVGLDDSTTAGSVVFRVLADDREIYSSDVMNADSPAQTVDVGVEDVHRLKLLVTNGFDGTDFDRFAVWADARVECE